MKTVDFTLFSSGSHSVFENYLVLALLPLGFVSAYRELAYWVWRISELVEVSCHSDRGIVPRRFMASLVPLPKKEERQSEMTQTAASSVLAPELVACVALQVCPILRYGLVRCNSTARSRQPPSLQHHSAAIVSVPLPISDQPVQGLLRPSRSACQPAQGTRSLNAYAHCCSDWHSSEPAWPLPRRSKDIGRRHSCFKLVFHHSSFPLICGS